MLLKYKNKNISHVGNLPLFQTKETTSTVAVFISSPEDGQFLTVDIYLVPYIEYLGVLSLLFIPYSG